MKKTLAIIACAFSLLGYSQAKKDTTNAIELDEIVVSAQRFAKQKRTISQQVETISKKEIELQNNQNTADIFANSGILAIQKSQQGGGSPVIRGFESSRILLLVDGIRMNNLIYRGGHLQNSITVDKNMLESADVLFGPSSTIYGSDALGGALYLQTKNAKLLSENGNKTVSGNVLANYSDVNKGKSSHFDFNYAAGRFASLTSVSYNDYGDLRMGKHKNGNNAFFGERDFYVETVNGVDIKVTNSDKYVQKFSGYKQYDFMQKFVFQQNSSTKHSLNFQVSTTNDVPRYDRLTEVNGSGVPKSATWKYGPQKRLLSAYKFSKAKALLKSDMNVNLSYQKVEESRINRNFGSLNQNNRIEKVQVFSLTTDFKAKVGKADLIYGADIYYDDLKSSAFKRNIITGDYTALSTRFPDGKNNTLKAEGFLAFSNNFNDKTSFNASARGGYTTLKSEIKTNFLNLPYTSIEQKNFTYSGAVGIVNNPSKDIKVAFNLASAYRAPNVDDLSKIFESAKGNSTTLGNLIVPNKDLKPEKSVTADLSITFWDGNRFQFENTFFITKLYDPILTGAYTLNGQSTVIFDGFLANVQANQNQGKGNLFGYSTTLKAYLTKSFLFYGNFNFTHGRVQNSTGNFPLDHIPPVYGKTGFRFENKYVNLDLNMNYSGNKNLANYSPSGEDNLIYAPTNGTPSWETYNFKAGITAIKEVTIFTGIENILDTQYRTFASGINAGGRNLYLGAKFSF